MVTLERSVIVSKFIFISINGFPFSENTPATGKGERASEYPSIAARISSPNLDPHQQ